jgi:hypothetical protein
VPLCVPDGYVLGGALDFCTCSTWVHEWVLFMTMGYKIYIMLGAHFSGNVSILCPMEPAHKLTTRAYIYIHKSIESFHGLLKYFCVQITRGGGGLLGEGCISRTIKGYCCKEYFDGLDKLNGLFN